MEIDIELNEKIGKLYNLFEDNINEVSKYLSKINVNPENWDINFLKKDSKKLIEQIQTRFIYEQDLDWRTYMNKIMSELIKKYLIDFSLVDKFTEKDQDKYEYYFDLLSCMIGNTEELLNIEYIAFSKKN